jgi:protein ImuA
MMLALDTGPAAPPLSLAPEVTLARPRAHEVTGASQRLFALLAGAAGEGTILWLVPRWFDERLMGDGIRPLVEPGRLLIGRCRGAVDILWCAEEALRSGTVPLVVAELPAPPALTPVRRLHLAAQAGAEAGGVPPLCLLLTPGDGGAPGVETRWDLRPVPGWAVDGRARWRLARLRARAAPPKAWTMLIETGRVETEAEIGSETGRAEARRPAVRVELARCADHAAAGNAAVAF